jgi:hypothetical protein
MSDYWWTVAELQQSTAESVIMRSCSCNCWDDNDLEEVDDDYDDDEEEEERSLRGLEFFYDKSPEMVHNIHVQTVLDDARRQQVLRGTVDAERLRRASLLWSKSCSEKAVAVAVADRADVERMWGPPISAPPK